MRVDEWGKKVGEETDEGLIGGGIKGEDGGCGVEDGEGVEVDLYVAGWRLCGGEG